MHPCRLGLTDPRSAIRLEKGIHRVKDYNSKRVSVGGIGIGYALPTRFPIWFAFEKRQQSIKCSVSNAMIRGRCTGGDG